RAGNATQHPAVGRLRPRVRRAAQAPGERGPDGPRSRGRLRVHQRQRPAAADHRGDPVGRGARHHHDAPQLAAPLRERPRRRYRAGRVAGQGAGRLLRAVRGRGEGRRALARAPARHRRAPVRLPEVLARGGRADHVAEDARRAAAGRDEAQEEGQADGPDARPHLRRRARVVLPARVGLRRRGGGPDGPAGTHGYHGAFSHAVMRYGKNVKLAKDFLTWLHGKQQFAKWFEVAEGFSVGSTKYWEQHPMWERVDPPMKIYRQAAAASRMIGYAGPPSARATEAYTKYIIVDMYAKACQGTKAEDAVKWAAGELSKIYG